MSYITYGVPGSGPGSGTVTSISAGTGITLTPNPITTTGTVALTVPVTIANGGTNAITMATSNGTNYFDGTRIVTTATGTSGFILTSNGAAAPTYQAPAASSISITGNTGGALVGNAFTFTGGTTGLTFNGAVSTETLSGTLVVANGGTGVATLTSHGLIYGNGTSPVGILAEASNGQIPIGSTGNAPVLANITASGNITVTNGAGTIALSATGAASFTWSVITADQSAAVNHGYICNKATTLVLTLPTTCAEGDIIEVTGINTATGWQVAQSANQQVFFGTSSTTLGATGTLTSSAIRDSLRIVCVVANLTFNVLSSTGNITVV